MSVKGTFKLDNPGAMEATVTLTMTVREWQDLAKQINTTSHPGWRVNSVITDLVLQAQKTLYATGEEA